MSTGTTFADVAESVRATLAAYVQALDDGRTDDVVATFCADGSVEIEGMGTHQGHDALRAAYASWVPRRPQRHLVLNTLVSDWNDHEARATSDVVFILQGTAGGGSNWSAATTTGSASMTASGGSRHASPPSSAPTTRRRDHVQTDREETR
jgi:hypothetical protein